MVFFNIDDWFFKNNKIDFTRFIIRRAFRIWPLYFFVMFCAVILVTPDNFTPYPGASTSPEQWTWFKDNCWKYILFLGNWWPHSLSEFGIMWTICVEEQFYLVLPLIAMFILKNPSKRGFLIVISCLLIGLFWRASFIHNFFNSSHPPYYLTITYIDSFSFGFLAAFLYQKKFNYFRVKAAIVTPVIFFTLIFLCLLMAN